MKGLKTIALSFGVLIAGFILFGFFRYTINPKITASSLCLRTDNCIKGLHISDSGASWLAFSQDGRLLFGEGSGARRWNVEKKFQTKRLGGSSTRRLAVAQDGRYAIVKKDADDAFEITVFDAGGKKIIEVSTVSKNIQFLSQLAFTTIADMLVMPIRDEENQNTLLSFWSLRTGEFVTQLPHAAPISSLATSAGIIAVGLSSGDIVLWPEGDFNRYSILKASETSIKELTFDAEGQVLASADNDGLIKVWDMNSKTFIAEFQNPNEYLTDIALSSSPNLLLASYANDDKGRILAWDTATAEQIGDWAYPRGVGKLAISPDGQQLALNLWRKSTLVTSTVNQTGPNRPTTGASRVIVNSQERSYVKVDPAVILIRDISDLSD
ncbi:MAG: hypothetical protein KC422_25835 [Trueperaceae bacterium]|nr:hypothetical protein [Trueperaceae bacterium]